MIDWPYSAPDVDLQPDTTVALALTGASGMPYAIRLLQCLLAARCKVWLLYSQVAQVVAAQALINISVVLSLMPTKGIPLPLVSSGGSSLLINLVGMGVLLNVSQHASTEE